MFFLISVPIAAGMLLSALPMRNYAMSDADHKKIIDALVDKRANAATATDAENKIEG